MCNCEKAARAATRGNLLFFGCVLLAILAGAFAATATDSLVLTLSLVLCGVFLVLACVLVYLHSRIADKYKKLAKAERDALAAKEAEEAEKNIEAFSEDGLPGAFCREIRGYSPAQLRLILDEQKDDYSQEEYAFIEKVEKEKA